ncbi:hypothetical protein [Fredinandcohnia quinoae]|uniref:YhfM-like domain-containing protein n=1 Tax=Fredinandcohnia quinoae TaxID=2918902 RepID=A0AAW5E1W7_9BACI|nr:hypothetical protein [Fredinandcohnia sp. SECRCQ15]MCH1625265.1 hypothetical protein [Fredinandcohnia sp. SECRCQ15]
MSLLDEKVSRINISKSNGVGDMNQDIILSVDDKKSVAIIEKAIRTAVKQESKIPSGENPDFDIMVEYEGGLPTHALHLWLGNEGEISTLSYMTDTGDVYITTGKTTNQLRDILF